VVFIVRQTWVLVYFLFATTCFSSMPFAADSFTANKNLENHMVLKYVYDRSQFQKKPLKQYGAPWTQYRCVKIHSIFFDFPVIFRSFRQYFNGDGKVSCILATISDWFRTIDLKTKVVSWCSLVIGQNASHQLCNHFWKFSRQCSMFGRIGDQWVANSSPDLGSNYLICTP